MSYLSTLRVKNFKAIRDSGPLKLRALTVFIGNNGAGESNAIARPYSLTKEECGPHLRTFSLAAESTRAAAMTAYLDPPED